MFEMVKKTPKQQSTPRKCCRKLGHSHQIWSGQVTVLSTYIKVYRAEGACSCRKFWEFRCSRGHFHTKISGQMADVCISINIYFPAHCTLRHAIFSASQPIEKRKIVGRMGLIRRTQKRLLHTVCSHLASFNTWHLTYQCACYMHVVSTKLWH